MADVLGPGIPTVQLLNYRMLRETDLRAILNETMILILFLAEWFYLSLFRISRPLLDFYVIRGNLPDSTRQPGNANRHNVIS